MYFKVDQNSELHKKLTALFTQGKEYRKAVNALIDEINAETGDDCTQYYGLSGRQGGFSSKRFNDANKVPASWNRTKHDSNAFYPSRANKFKKENKGILSKIDALPILQHSAFSKSIDYGCYTGEENGKMVISSAPGIIPGETILIEMYDFAIQGGYKPVAGMIEIKASEFHALKESRTEKAAQA